jgi:hypothetical protein
VEGKGGVEEGEEGVGRIRTDILVGRRRVEEGEEGGREEVRR